MPNPNTARRIAFHHIFTDTEVQQLRTALQPSWYRAEIDHEEIDEQMRFAYTQACVPNEASLSCFKRLYQYIEAANQALWNFELHGFDFEHDPPNFVRYTVGGHHQWHIDHDARSSTRKLTFIVQLSAEHSYTGGSIHIFPQVNFNAALRKAGTLIIFPVYVPHRITPVTQGERLALVGWVHGPPFR